MEDEPLFTANNQETETHRIVRLHMVWGYVVALAEHYGNRDIFKKVTRLHDHKGGLVVTWKEEGTAGEKEFFDLAWLSNIGDGCDSVEHEKA